MNSTGRGDNLWNILRPVRELVSSFSAATWNCLFSCQKRVITSEKEVGHLSNCSPFVLIPVTLYNALADPRGGARDAPPPPWGSKFFHFHAVFGKKLKNNSTFGSWRPPPGENPGSATAMYIPVLSYLQ